MMNLQSITLPEASPGSSAKLNFWHYGQRGNSPKIYIQSSLHADEWPGILVLHHLHKLLQTQNILGEICIVPCANPIGMRQFLGGYALGRFDFDYSGNFNRHYLDLAEAALPYIDALELMQADEKQKIIIVRRAFKAALENHKPLLEADVLRTQLQLLAHDADFVLDLHCDARACAHIFANRKHEQTAQLLAQAMRLNPLILEGDIEGMAFDDAAASVWWRLQNKLSIALPPATFAATIELRGERDINDAFAIEDAHNLLHFLTLIAAVAPNNLSAAPRDDFSVTTVPLEGVMRVVAPASGLVVFKVEVGDDVVCGQEIAQLIDPCDPQRARLSLVAPDKGVVYALSRNNLLRPGHVVAQIAGKSLQGAGKLAF